MRFRWNSTRLISVRTELQESLRHSTGFVGEPEVLLRLGSIVAMEGELTMARSRGPIYEYACHEGNYSLENLLRGYRAAERQPAGPAVRCPASPQKVA